jgi:hypothetical protein
MDLRVTQWEAGDWDFWVELSFRFCDAMRVPYLIRS